MTATLGLLASFGAVIASALVSAILFHLGFTLNKSAEHAAGNAESVLQSIAAIICFMFACLFPFLSLASESVH